MNIAVFYRHFPVAMGRWIHWGLEQAGHKVISVGPWSRGTIPWENTSIYPKRYWYPPKIETPDVPEIKMEDIFKILKEKGWKVDMVIQAADTYFLKGKAPVPNILIGTDPHVIDYHAHLQHVDQYVSMQKFYSEPGDLWMPYAYDPQVHHYLMDSPILFDVVFCGLQYEHRKEALSRMAQEGYKVFSGLGYIYDEYVMLYNQGIVAFNWSSKQDLPARFWEGLAMRRLVLTNRVPDLELFPDLKEDRDYLAFSTIDEAVSAVKLVMQKPDLIEKIASSGYQNVYPHTYRNRVIKLLKELDV